MAKRIYKDFQQRLDKELESRRNPPAPNIQANPVMKKLMDIKSKRMGR